MAFMEVDVPHKPISVVLAWFVERGWTYANVGNSTDLINHTTFFHYIVDHISVEDALLFKLTFPECNIHLFDR